MDEGITIEHKGVHYTATYDVFGDSITVYLPSGEKRTSELRGLNPEGAALHHLKAYVSSFSCKRQ